MDWTAILSEAGIAESPGYAETAAGMEAFRAAREARRGLAPTEAARQELERIQRAAGQAAAR
jgi:hypothetical protein